jgi:hypothetical protein
MAGAAARKVIGVGLAVCVIAGCGVWASALGPSAYGRTYVRLAAPVDRARFRFDDALVRLGSHPSRAALRKVAMPLSAAIRKLDPELVEHSWPPKVEPDIEALVAADANLLQALDSGAIHHRLTPSRWATAIIDTSGSVNSADAMVHARLGLAPPY